MLNDQTPHGANKTSAGEGKGNPAENVGRWKAPTIIGGIGGCIMWFAGLNGHWYDLPVKVGLAIMLAGISYGFYELMVWLEIFKKPRHRVGLAILTFCVLFSGEIFIYTKFPESNARVFSIVARQEFIGVEKPRFYLLWNNGPEAVLSPVHVVLWAQFANLRTMPLTVISYQFEGKTTNSVWETMPSIIPSLGSLVFVRSPNGNLDDAVIMDVGETVFPGVILNKSMSPGTIGAWIFLEAPKSGFAGSIRLKIIDGASEYIESVEFASMTNSLDMRTQDVSKYNFSPLGEDIRKLRILPYSQHLQGR